MLTQKLILSFSSKIIVKILQFIGTIIVARLAGPTVLGTVAYGLAYVSIFGFIADLGSGTAHIKLVAEGNNKEEDCNTTFVIIRLCLLLLFSIILVLYYYIQQSLFGFSFPSTQHKWVVFVSFITIILVNIINILIGIFSAKTEQAKQDIPNIIKTILNQSIRIIVVILGYGAVAISLSSLIALIFVTPIYFFFFRKIIFGTFDKELAKKYLKISLPLIIVVAVNSYISFGDKLILQHYTDSEQVGVYVAGYRLADFILLIAGSVGLLFFPTFTKLIGENNIVRVNDILNKFERLSFSFILPFVFGLFLFSDFFVNAILGVEYKDSAIILSVITLSLFIFTITMPYGNIITARNAFGMFALISIIKGTVFTIAAGLFVSEYGMALKGYGMALSILFSNLLFAIALVIGAIRMQKDINIFQSWRILFFAIIYSILFYFSLDVINIQVSSFYNLIPLGLYFIGYWLFAYIIRVINSDDFLMILNVLKLSKIKDYVKGELSNK